MEKTETAEEQAVEPLLQLQSHTQQVAVALHQEHDDQTRQETQTPASTSTPTPTPTQQQPHPVPPAAHDASATPDPAQMSQHAPPLPPMQYQVPAYMDDGVAQQPPPQHANNSNNVNHQTHPQPPPHHAPPPPPVQRHQNGHAIQYPAFSYAPEATMQQPPPPPPMQTNGAPPTNGYPPHMPYQVPLPPQHMNTNQSSTTRHKKEIKRRTKTGCLTCRKRRIKCDEGHPTCRNCQKSKRECLGYDPIFKAQGQPATIQPAPGSHAPPPPPAPKAEAQMLPDAPQYSNIPQGYMPAASAGYSPASAMQPPMDYATAIDPALAPVNSALAPPPPPPPLVQEEYSTSLRPQRNVRNISVDTLFALDDIPPSSPPPRDTNTPLPPHEIESIRSMYSMEYAHGLDRFFETTWYTDHGFNLLLGHMELLHFFAYCLDRFRQAQAGQNLHGLMSLEARLVWLLCCLPRSVQSNPLPPHLVTLLQRIDTVQNLLLGTFMDPSLVPVSPPATPPDPKTAPEQYAQYLLDSFWHHLGRFVSIRDDQISPDAAQQIAAALAAMRNILSMLENRDVLYSMAIARHFGGRMVDFHLDKVLVSNSAEPDDPIAKLSVAMNFIRGEDTQGTTQVVQRLCGMCRRGWVVQRQG